jgi:hypothetical protein
MPVGVPMFISDKMIPGTVQPVQPIDRPDPESLFLIFIYTSYIVVTNTGTIAGVVAVNHHLVPVVPVQTIPGADPDKTPAVLENRFDRAVGKPLLAGNMGKSQRWRLRPDRSGHKKTNDKYE